VPDDDRDRPRKSWREIDAKRDRSSQTSSRDRDGAKPGKGQQRAQKSYRAALDRLFETGGVAKLLEGAAGKPAAPDEATETRAKLVAKVVAALGPDEVTRAVDGYLAKYPAPPEDFEFLGAMLQHREEPRVAEAMQALTALLDAGLKPKRPRAIAAHLRMIEEVGDEPALRRSAAELRRRIG
jgi:hypothetical protein